MLELQHESETEDVCSDEDAAVRSPFIISSRSETEEIRSISTTSSRSVLDIIDCSSWDRSDSSSLIDDDTVLTRDDSEQIDALEFPVGSLS